MKIIPLVTLVLSLVFMVACSQTSKVANKKNKASLTAHSEVLAYALGVNIGESIQSGGFSEAERNSEKITEGFMAGFEVDSVELATSMEILQKRMGAGGEPITDKEEGGKIALELGKTIMGPLAIEIEMDKADFDRTAFKMGLEAGMGMDSIVIDEVVRDSVLRAYIAPKNEAYMKVARAKQEAAMEAERIAAQPTIQAGEAFLAENKERPGIITTASGLQYKILEEGTGTKPTLNDRVKVHYHGTLLDGTVFDSSVDRGEPAVFGVGQVIRGWQEGLPLMKEGARYRFYIPQELAYGIQSPSSSIPAGALMIFDVELLEVNPNE